jgi:hypothetical protein
MSIVEFAASRCAVANVSALPRAENLSATASACADEAVPGGHGSNAVDGVGLGVGLGVTDGATDAAGEAVLLVPPQAPATSPAKTTSSASVSTTDARDLDLDWPFMTRPFLLAVRLPSGQVPESTKTDPRAGLTSGSPPVSGGRCVLPTGQRLPTPILETRHGVVFTGIR